MPRSVELKTLLVGVVIIAAAGIGWALVTEKGEAPNTTALTEIFSGELLPIVLEEKTAFFADGTEAVFRLPQEFDITVAAEGLGKARFMALSPDGRIFVPDMVNYNLSHEGKLYVLGSFNEEEGRFEEIHTYLSNLRGPNSVAFYTDEEGQDWLYLALTAHLVRYPYEAGDVEPSGEPEIITEFPNTQTPGETSVVWHITRTLQFHDDKLYIAIGSGCNSCEQLPGAMRGMIVRMNPDGSEREVYADGLRNTVGLEWALGSLYATANGVDHLGANAPDELMYKIDEDTHYGWPYCYALDGEMVPDTSQEWSVEYSCAEAPEALAFFAPRSAPLGLHYFEEAHQSLEGAFLVALHGSFDPSMRTGYEIVRVTPEGEQEIFMDGFQLPNDERVARPVDFFQWDENSFLFTDDHGGRIFYVSAS